MKRNIPAVVTIALLATLAACAPPFPKELLDSVDRTISYEALHASPDRYAGKILLLGGVIVETRNVQKGTQIEVLQRPLDNQGRPKMTDETGGRFIILSPQFLDAAVYQKGRAVSVIGEAAGSRTGVLGELEYRYPLVAARQVHLWEYASGPRVQFGIGVFKSF